MIQVWFKNGSNVRIEADQAGWVGRGLTSDSAHMFFLVLTKGEKEVGVFKAEDVAGWHEVNT